MRWTAPTACLLLAAAVALPALPAGAVGPLDNDAGSGRDAGDVSALAVPVAPGTYTGTVRLGVDEFDWYSFAATQGQWLHASVAGLGGGAVHMELYGPATGTPMEQLDGGLDYDGTSLGPAFDFVILETGTWYLRVNPLTSPPAATNAYRFSFSLTTPATSKVVVTPGNWAAAEANFAAPTDVAYLLRMEFDTESEHAYFGDLYEEATPGFPFAIGVLGDAGVGGGTVSIRPSPVPDTKIPHVTTGTNAQSIALGTIVMHGFFGPLRLTVTNSLPHVRLILALAALGPATTATATGSGSVLWEEANRDVPNRIITPVLTKEDAGDLTLSTAPRFLGIFTTGAGGGWATDPSGHRLDVSPTCSCLTSDAWAPWTPGTWTFHEGAALTVGSPNEHPYLVGSYVPTLGVY